jgi:hypothetical protein
MLYAFLYYKHVGLILLWIPAGLPKWADRVYRRGSKRPLNNLWIEREIFKMFKIFETDHEF